MIEQTKDAQEIVFEKKDKQIDMITTAAIVSSQLDPNSSNIALCFIPKEGEAYYTAPGVPVYFVTIDDNTWARYTIEDAHKWDLICGENNPLALTGNKALPGNRAKANKNTGSSAAAKRASFQAHFRGGGTGKASGSKTRFVKRAIAAGATAGPFVAALKRQLVTIAQALFSPNARKGVPQSFQQKGADTALSLRSLSVESLVMFPPGMALGQ